MKPSAETPRFVCRITRQWLAVFGGEDAASRSAHVAGCEDCQAFFSLGDELESFLRRDAAVARVAPSPMLEQKILHAVHRSAAPERRRSLLPLYSLVGAAAAVAVVFVTLRPTPQAEPALNPVEEGKQALAQVMQFVPKELFTEMKPQAEAILSQDPVQSEIEGLRTNAKSAVQFLAKNFLPADKQQALASRSNG